MDTGHLVDNYYIKERINNRLIRMGLTPMSITRSDISFYDWENRNIEFKLYDNIGWALKNNTIYYCHICNNVKMVRHRITLKCKHSICMECEKRLQPKLCPFCRTSIYDNIEVDNADGDSDGNANEHIVHNHNIPYLGDISICEYIKVIIYNNIVNILLVCFFISVFIFIFIALIDYKNKIENNKNTTNHNTGQNNNYQNYNLI